MNGILILASFPALGFFLSIFFIRNGNEKEEKEKKENLRKGSGKMQLKFVLCEVMLV